jgi:membrane associated rhomboid family serine protease
MSNYYRPRALGGFGLFPPAIKTLIIINVSVFLFEFLFGSYGFGRTTIDYIFRNYLYLIPYDFHTSLNEFAQSGRYQEALYINKLYPDAIFLPWQLITYQFLHGDFFHIFFNLFALWMFGIELETLWGTKKFIIFYLLCGIGAGLTQVFISPLLDNVLVALPFFSASQIALPTVGASGSVFGILLAFGLTYPDRPIFMFPLFFPIPAKYFVMIYAGMSVVLGVSSSGDGVAHFAHLGGALSGFLLIKFGDKLGIYSLFRRKQEYIGSTYQAYEKNVFKTDFIKDPEPKRTNSPKNFVMVNGEIIPQAKIDELLDKISATGYQNLSEDEKQLLVELSKKL